MRRCLLLACLSLSTLWPALVEAEAAADTWMSVLLDGRKIGSMHTTRDVRDASVITAQEMRVELVRAGFRVALSTSEVDTESSSGEPQSFVSVIGISGMQTTIRGTRRGDGRFDISSTTGGAQSQRVIDWPPGALLAEGLRLSMLHHGLDAGTHYTALAFQVENQQAVRVDTTIGPRERIDLPGGARERVRVEQVVHLPGAATRTRSWVGADGEVVKSVLPVMGMDLTLLACSKACATAPNQDADILVHALAPAPAGIAPSDLRNGLRIDIARSSGEGPLEFARTDEQQIEATANGAILRIAPVSAGGVARQAAPVRADTQANEWLQADAEPIRELARRGVGDAKDAAGKMHNLQEFVRAYIHTKDLSVGYASALEVARKPEGDCTEHAVLLAALGRAAGIPTHVVDGLAYAPAYAGKPHVFVPHAWVQAYVDGRWRSYDAALNGFDAGHIALAVGDGEPWSFFGGFDTIGRMRIERVAPLPSAASKPD